MNGRCGGGAVALRPPCLGRRAEQQQGPICKPRRGDSTTVGLRRATGYSGIDLGTPWTRGRLVGDHNRVGLRIVAAVVRTASSLQRRSRRSSTAASRLATT